MNPLAMMMQMMQGGGNPMAIAQQFAGQDPRLQNAMQMIRGKSPQQLEQTFYNLCQSYGINPQDIARQAGVTLPKR